MSEGSRTGRVEASRIAPVLAVFESLGRATDVRQTLEALLDGAERLLGATAAQAYVVDPVTRELGPPFGRGYSGGDGTIPELVRDVLESRRARVEGEGDGARLVLPLGGDEPVGVLVVRPPGPLDAETRRLAESYAAAAGAAVGRALLRVHAEEGRRLESELLVARRVMAGLLPRKVPRLEGCDIAVAVEPCYEVGGDYYDFIPLGHDRHGLAIADVAGKGVPAALLVAAMRAALYLLARQELALRAVLARTNLFFHETAGREGKFVTLFYGVMDLRARRIIYVNAGHLPPVVLRADGGVELLEEGGVPLGPFAEARYFEGFVRLRTGDVLALYTDGITEATNEKGEEFGRPRLVDCLRGAREGDAAAIRDAVMRAVRGFGGPRLADDQTLVILKAT